MQTQILQRPVYTDEHHRATLRCPRCGRTKVAEVTRYEHATRLPRVKCACGHRFRVHIVAGLLTRYACQTCGGKGYLTVKQGKKVAISEEGYHYQTLQSKELCTMCRGLGMHYPKAKNAGLTAVPQRALAFLATHALAHMDWIAEKLGAPRPTIRTWLERDICEIYQKKAWGPKVAKALLRSE